MKKQLDTDQNQAKRRSKVILLAVFAVSSASVLAMGLLQSRYKTEQLEHDGRTRTFNVRVPSSAKPNAKLPVVIVLHGGGGNAQNAETMSQLTPFAERNGFIVCYPNGTGRLANRLLTWNAGNCCGYALENKVDDVGFFSKLIDHLIAKYSVDPSRVCVTGMSNGGMMSHQAGVLLSTKIAAIGPVAGALNGAKSGGSPVGVIMIHGEADQNVLIVGGRPKKSISAPRVDNSLANAVTFWTKQNDLAGSTPQVKTVGKATITTYPGKFQVQTVTIKGEGHTWPGGRRGSSRGDDPSEVVVANELLWNFFKQHQR